MRRPPFRISPGRVALSAAPATSRMPVARSRSDASGGASYALNSRCCRLTRPVAESVIATSTAYRPGRAAKAKCSASDALATPSIAAGTLWLHDCDGSPSRKRAPRLHPQHRAATTAGLPADAETQVVRPTQQPEIAPRVVEPELEVALAVRNAAAHGQPVAREAARALAGRDPLQVDVADVVGGLDRITPPPGQRESRVAQVRPGPLQAGPGARLVVVGLIELGEQRDAIRPSIVQVQRHA